MLVRVVRAILGTTLLLVGLPSLLIGGVLWYAMQHQDPTGGYSARLSPVSTAGHAVVASDVDALLRREAPFARGGQTTLRLTATTPDGPAFVGLAPARDVARYLAGVPYQRVEGVRLARGPLPVVSVPVDGVTVPAGPPGEQRFWVLSSETGLLEWSPYQLRDQRLAVVVMARDGSAPLNVDLTARVQPRWLDSTTYALLVLGLLLSVGGVVVLAWPGRSREVVYVVPSTEMPEIAARLGIPLPREDTGGFAAVAATAPVAAAAVAATAAVPATADPAVATDLDTAELPAAAEASTVTAAASDPGGTTVAADPSAPAASVTDVPTTVPADASPTVPADAPPTDSSAHDVPAGDVPAATADVPGPTAPADPGAAVVGVAATGAAGADGSAPGSGAVDLPSGAGAVPASVAPVVQPELARLMLPEAVVGRPGESPAGTPAPAASEPAAATGEPAVATGELAPAATGEPAVTTGRTAAEPGPTMLSLADLPPLAVVRAGVGQPPVGSAFEWPPPVAEHVTAAPVVAEPFAAGHLTAAPTVADPVAAGHTAAPVAAAGQVAAPVAPGEHVVPPAPVPPADQS